MLTGHRQREETEVSDALVEEGGYKTVFFWYSLLST